MNTTTITTPLGTDQGIDLLDTAALAPAPKKGLRKLAERGLTTAEYAVGLLGAVTFALILLRMFKDNRLFETLFKYVFKLIEMASNQIG